MAERRTDGRPRTVAEAAAELGVSVGSIRLWIRQRRIGYMRLGRVIRIPQAEIARFMEAGYVPAAEWHR